MLFFFNLGFFFSGTKRLGAGVHDHAIRLYAALTNWPWAGCTPRFFAGWYQATRESEEVLTNCRGRASVIYAGL